LALNDIAALEVVAFAKVPPLIIAASLEEIVLLVSPWPKAVL
jgi:hypothetical protein